MHDLRRWEDQDADQIRKICPPGGKNCLLPPAAMGGAG